MKRIIFTLTTAILISVLATLLLSSPQSIQAANKNQASVSFSETEIINNFPGSLTFHTNVVSSVTIESAKIFFYDQYKYYRDDLEIDPGKDIDLTYKWTTGRLTIPPFTPISYHWQITLENKEIIESEESVVYYDDNRYDWGILEEDKLILRWHDREDSFGEKSFDIVLKAYQQQKELFGVELDDPIQIIVYNNDEDFLSWQNDPGSELFKDSIGGKTFAIQGITTLVVKANYQEDRWLNEIIPHQISGLYFYQATKNPISSPPSWLNVGVAQYNEFNSVQTGLENAKMEINKGNYISLRSLSLGFGYTKNERRLAFDESISAVSYLTDTYGEQGLRDLIAAYRNGLNTEDAIPTALGVTFERFEFNWLASLGVPDGMYTYAENGITLQVDPTLINTPQAIPTSPTFPTLYPEMGQRFLSSFCLSAGVLVLLAVGSIAVIVFITMALEARARKSD